MVNDLEFDNTFFFKTFTGISKILSDELYRECNDANISTLNIDDIYSFITIFLNKLSSNNLFYIYVDKNNIYKDLAKKLIEC